MKTISINYIKFKLAPVVVAAVVMVGLSSSVSAAIVRAEIKDLVNPLYPTMLSSMGVLEGSATVLIDIDADGNMIDWLALSCTNEEFVSAIERVIDKWTFTPATEDGTPIPYAMSVTVKFKAEGILMAINGVQIVQAYMNGMFEPVERSLVSRYSDLDGMPTPVKVIQPMLSKDIPEENRSGEVVLGFFIDPAGKVRMPVMLECNGDMCLAYAAYDAIMQWQFEVPTVRGRPTMVRARQKFIFTSPPKASK